MKKAALFCLMMGIAAVAGFVLTAEPVTVTFLGHSCFTFQAEGGSIVMLDPYATYVPYPGLPQPADVVLMTHGHIDHCPPCYGETDRYTGDPRVVAPWNSQGRTQEGTWRIAEDLVVRFIEATHVTSSGGGQGYVTLFAFEIGGIRFAHLGDLGRTLSDSQIEALGDVDVLCIPVGGAFTIDAAEALTVIGQLPSVKIVLPIHYYVDGITPWTDMAPLSDFLSVAEGTYEIVEKDAAQVILTAEDLPEETQIWVLDYLD
jgi:L-ascorbate metabolism protein UlaG (beta-lactamase superfamily)